MTLRHSSGPVLFVTFHNIWFFSIFVTHIHGSLMLTVPAVPKHLLYLHRWAVVFRYNHLSLNLRHLQKKKKTVGFFSKCTQLALLAIKDLIAIHCQQKKLPSGKIELGISEIPVWWFPLWATMASASFKVLNLTSVGA